MLSKKETDILIFLSKSEDCVNAQLIAQALGFSVRSIKSYIKNINALYKNTIISTREGYYLADQHILQLLSKNTMPQTKNERIMILFKELLIHNQHMLIEDLAQHLCISSETLLKEVRELNQQLKPFHIYITSDDVRIYALGDEANKRSAISNFILTDIKNSVFTFRALNLYYPNYQIEKIQDIIVSTLRLNAYFLDDYSVFNLLLHIIIVIDRNKNNLTSTKEHTVLLKDHAAQHAYRIASLICTKIEEETSFSFSSSDIYDLSLLLFTRLMPLEKKLPDLTLIKQTFSSDTLSLLHDIETLLQSTYNLSFSNDNYRIRFYIHIKNLILRITNKVSIVNPMINEMRHHIYIYDVAISIASLISDRLHTMISEDEVAYIGMHLFFSFGEEMNQKAQLNTLLICPNYGEMQSMLIDNILSIFKNELTIVEITSDFPKEIKQAYDLVLSSFSCNELLPYSYLHVSIPLNNKEILALSSAIESKKDKNKKIRFKEELQYFFKKEFFYFEPLKHLKMQDVFEQVASHLYAAHYVPENFKEKLYEREEKYSSAYQAIAIPHPLEQIAYHSAISIFICSNGITWGNNTNVKIVFTLALYTKDQTSFKRIFDLITDLLTNKQVLNQLLKEDTYEKFIDRLIELCDY